MERILKSFGGLFYTTVLIGTWKEYSGMAFANSVMKSGVCGDWIGLVSCAVGGTAIREWARGARLYEGMIKRAKEAVKDGSGEIRATTIREWARGARLYEGMIKRAKEAVKDGSGEIRATTIREWAHGARLYEGIIKRAKEAVKDGSGEIRAMLWFQGESDTETQHEVDVYGKLTEELIRNVRADLGLPSLPIIQVAIVSGEDSGDSTRD